MHYRKLWTLTWALASVALFSLANVSIGREDDSSDRSERGSNASNASTDQSGSPGQNREQNTRDTSDEQHHAALGVTLAEENGQVYVVGVMPGSPAAKAGLRHGDEIRKVGEERVRSAEQIAEEISENKPGSRVELTIRRNGETQTVKAKLASRQSFNSQEGYGRNSNWNQNANSYAANDQNEGRWNRSQWQANRGRSAYSYQPNQEQGETNRQSTSQGWNQQNLSQQVRTLQQEVSRLQQQVEELQSNLENRNQRGRM